MRPAVALPAASLVAEVDVSTVIVGGILLQQDISSVEDGGTVTTTASIAHRPSDGLSCSVKDMMNQPPDDTYGLPKYAVATWSGLQKYSAASCWDRVLDAGAALVSDDSMLSKIVVKLQLASASSIGALNVAYLSINLTLRPPTLLVSPPGAGTAVRREQ